MNIPVFHDDQHGTAIISTAAILNGLRVVEKISPTCGWWSPARARRRLPV
jgi:malate dehydrogenase (oxaloacetate-decarboxylating)(NADP+)